MTTSDEIDTELAAMRNELDLRDRELVDLCYGLSHDLRSPLRTIAGFSDALAEDYADRLDDTGRDYITRVRAAATRMDLLITSLTELGSVTRTPLRREPVDLSSIAASVTKILQLNHAARTVDISIEPGVVVEGDAELLRRALEHLFANAWKFTSKKESARVELGTTELDGSRTIFIRDDGAGFDPAFTHKLFVPFQRLHSPSEFDGNGIGLAVVRRIIYRHGGSVSASGAVDEGATFYLRLK